MNQPPIPQASLAAPKAGRRIFLRTIGWLLAIGGIAVTVFAVLRLAQGPAGHIECSGDGCLRTMDEAYNWDFPIPIFWSLTIGVIALIVGIGILGFTRQIKSGPTSPALASLFMPGNVNVFQMVKAAKKMADASGITITHGPSVTSFGMNMSGSSLQLQGETIDGQATIVEATPSGLEFGGLAMYVLQLNVTGAGGSSYPASTIAMVPTTALGRLQQGMSVPVKISRASPAAVQVDLGTETGSTGFGAGFTPT